MVIDIGSRGVSVIVNSVVKLHVNMVGVYGEFSIGEIRLFNCCLLNNDQGILFKRDKYYPVNVDRFCTLGNLQTSKGMQQIKEIVSKYKEAILKIPLTEGGTLVTSLIYDYIYSEETNTVLINWNEKLLHLLSGDMPSGKFLLANPIMDTTPSNKRYALYLLIQRHLWILQKEPYFILTEEEIRNLLKLEDKYPEVCELTKKVIKPTLDEIYNKVGIKLKAKTAGTNIKFMRQANESV